MAMGSGSGRGQNSDMNVTPLIDVLLVLLIIFMVITPLTPQGVAALVPQAPKNDGQPQPGTIVVQVLDQGVGQEPMVKINQESATWGSLQERLTSVYKLRAEKVMFVKADDNVAFESVAKAIDIGHASGADKVGLITLKTDLPKGS